MNKTRSTLFWLALVAALFVFIYLIRPVLLPFILGIGTAYLLDPLADRLERRKFGRTTATVLITCSFFLFITIICIIGIPLIAGQVSSLVSTLPGYIEQFNSEVLPGLLEKMNGVSPSLVAEIKTNLSSSSGMLAKAFANFLGGMLASGIAFVNIISLVLITPIVTFYLLRDWDRIIALIDELLPRKHADVIREQCALIDETLAGFIRGQLNVCILLGLYYAIGLSLVGLSSGFLIGLVTGFLAIFPYVGLLVGMATGLLVAFFQFGDVVSILMVLAVFVSGQILEGNFVTPKLVGDKVGLHPVWVIFALLAGGTLFGFVGVLIAVPFAAVIGVLTRFAISQYRLSSYHQ